MLWGVKIAAGPWRDRLTGSWATAGLLLAFYVVLLGSLRERSATMDEPGHATAGYIYWKYGDYRVDPENGNLSKRWIALPLLFGDTRFPEKEWLGPKKNLFWVLAESWFNRSGNDPAALLARGRAMSGLVAVALGAAVWFWARRLFGPTGGMLSLLLYVCNPTILANGCLMTSDTPAALGFLLSLLCLGATLQRITAARVVAGTFAIAGLFLAKMSAVLLLPMALLLALARVADGRPLPVGRTRVVSRRRRQAAALALVALGQALGVVLLVWAAYGFRYSAFSARGPEPHHFTRPWQWALGLPEPRQMIDALKLSPSTRRDFESVLARPGASETGWTYDVLEDLQGRRDRLTRPDEAAAFDRTMNAPPPHWVPRLIYAAREYRLLPESFLYGYANVWRTSGKLAAFLNGEIRETGWRTFFPYAFAVKTPLALLALLGIALVTAILLLRMRRLEQPWAQLRAAAGQLQPFLPLLVLLAVYWTAAIASHLNIGHRHLLPIYPPLLVLCGGCVRWFSPAPATDGLLLAAMRRWLRPTIVVLVILLLGEAAYRFPNYIAYFNGLVSPSRAYRHLVDSSLDWGQDLPSVARYLRARPTEPAYLAYFGIGSPEAHGITAKTIGGYPNVDWKLLAPVKAVLGTDPAAFLRAHPVYAADPVFRVDGGTEPGALFLHQASRHRLTAGLYLISASMLQPLYCGKVNSFWTPSLELRYRQLRETLAPFLSDARAAKVTAIPTRSVAAWEDLFEEYYDFRLARLATYLRAREPDDTVNFSVLVYRLTEADLVRALDGPLP